MEVLCRPGIPSLASIPLGTAGVTFVIPDGLDNYHGLELIPGLKRCEKPMKLYQFTLFHLSGSNIFSFHFFGGREIFKVSQAQMKANAEHSILTPILFYDIGAAMDTTARHPSHSAVSITWHFQAFFL